MAKVSIMRIVMGFTATLMLLDVAVAVDYTVGSPNGAWDLSTDLATWASSQTFTVGDNLVFQYDSSHDVLEVSRANYDSCGIGSPISTSLTSPTTIPLSSAGTRYFICGRGSHCSQGMKVEIDIVAASSGPPQSTTPPSPTPPRNGPPSNSSPPPPTNSSPAPPTTGVPVDPPSSAITLKTTSASVIGFGLFVIMLL